MLSARSRTYRTLSSTFALAILLALAACLPARGHELGSPPASISTQAESERPVQYLGVEVLSTFPHDPGAFTQGLLLNGGSIYESTGLNGRSSLRQVDRETGQVIRAAPVDPAYFAEGLALVGNRLIQLTWQSGAAFVYDLQSFERTGQFTYQGEGWGLCYDGESLVMSNGSSSLTFRNPDTFDVVRTVGVTLDGAPVERLNELECVGDSVYANIWTTDRIVRINKDSGRVAASIDASRLMTTQERMTADVLNGIAYDSERDTFLVTGKLWPKLFEVRFVE